MFGVLLAIGFFVAVALPTLAGHYPGTLWSLLLVLLAGATFLCPWAWFADTHETRVR